MSTIAITGDVRILVMEGVPSRPFGRSVESAVAGWSVIEVADEVGVLSAVRSRQVDIVLLHVSVDDTVEMDLPRVLRQVAPGAYLPVVIIADNAAEQHRCRFLNSGADDVLTAETSADEMIARICALLRVKELHDQLAASRTALQESLSREHELLAKLRRDNEYWRTLATTDSLTRVQNVRSFRDILEHEFRAARRYGLSLSLLMLDVDHFKVVNDTHGHSSGDYVLKELAVIFKRSVRDSDVVARTGGEEFSIILPRAGRKESARFAERIRREVYRRKFIVYGSDIHVTISIGSASYPADAEITDPLMLAHFADQALLKAKEFGRDRVVEFRQLDNAVRRRLRRQYLKMPLTKEEEPLCEPAVQPAE